MQIIKSIYYHRRLIIQHGATVHIHKVTAHSPLLDRHTVGNHYADSVATCARTGSKQSPEIRPINENQAAGALCYHCHKMKDNSLATLATTRIIDWNTQQLQYRRVQERDMTPNARDIMTFFQQKDRVWRSECYSPEAAFLNKEPSKVANSVSSIA